MFKLLSYAFLLCIGVSYISCGENEEPIIVITDEDIIGKWNFQEITGSTIGQSDTDENPEGFVQFNADGTGESSFNTELLGVSFIEEHTITWERVGDNQVYIYPGDGTTDIWTVESVSENEIHASWDLSFGGVNSGTISAVMIRG